MPRSWPWRPRSSDSYHDAALHWAVLAMVGTLAAFAAWPPLLTYWFETCLRRLATGAEPA